MRRWGGGPDRHDLGQVVGSSDETWPGRGPQLASPGPGGSAPIPPPASRTRPVTATARRSGRSGGGWWLGCAGRQEVSAPARPVKPASSVNASTRHHPGRTPPVELHTNRPHPHIQHKSLVNPPVRGLTHELGQAGVWSGGVAAPGGAGTLVSRGRTSYQCATGTESDLGHSGLPGKILCASLHISRSVVDETKPFRSISY